MKKTATALPDVWILEPEIYGDERGHFFESYNARKFHQLGIGVNFVQDNHSKSRYGVLRGLHFQRKMPQAKLVRVVTVIIYDVAVDIRFNSPNYGRYVGEILSSDNKRSLYVPSGFAHGFLVLSEVAEITYKCSEFYSPADERGIIWSDPTINIAWPAITCEPILSVKDGKYGSLSLLGNSDLPDQIETRR